MKKIIIIVFMLFALVSSVNAFFHFNMDSPPPLTIGALSEYFCNVNGTCYLSELITENLTTIYTYNATEICLENNCISSWTNISASGGGKSGDGIYLYNTSDTMYFNETKLNDTISLLDTSKSGDGIYLYNTSDTMYFNETKLNDTIDTKISQSGGGGGSSNISSTNFMGSSCTGFNLVKQLDTNISNIISVSMEREHLIEGIDYTLSDDIINFNLAVYDFFRIMVMYIE